MVISRNQRIVRNTVIYVSAVFIMLYSILPIAWMVLTSFKSSAEIMMSGTNILPDDWTSENYIQVFSKSSYIRYFMNSIIVTLSATALVMVCAILSGYSFSSAFNYRGKNLLMIIIIIARMVPEIAIIIPMYFFIQKIGLYDTKMGIILLVSATSYPLATWLMKSFFDNIHESLYDAAKIDGCSSFQTLRRIVLPISGPSISSSMIITFLTIWNSFLIPLSMAKTEKAKTFPVAISELAYGEFGVNWGNLSALSVVAVIPMFIIGILAQKYIIAGLTSGAVKE